MAFILTKNSDTVQYGLIEGYVNSANEIANLSTKYQPGSKVKVLATGDEYVLTLDNKWTKVQIKY